ncbi:MAG: flippase-like domain-containing protein [Chloroflexi bacterium]|nr:flippase-like domain-containing protein [Chloroflexota bacterium]
MSGVLAVYQGRTRTVIRWGVVCLVLAFWGIYLWRNGDSLWSHDWQVNYYWLALSFLVVLVFWATLVVIWQRVLIASGGRLGLRAAARLWATSMLARYLPGGMWHIAGRVYLAQEAGESRAAVLVSTVMEQILCLITSLLLLLISLPFWDTDYARFTPALLLVLPLAATVHPAVLRRLGGIALRFAGRKAGRIGAPALAVESFSPPAFRSVLKVAALYALPNLLAALSLYLSAAAVGPVSPGQFPAFEGAYTFGWVLGFFAVFAPSGLGVREGAIAVLLAPIVGAPVALAASILNRVVFSAGEAVFVAVCWGITRGQEGKRRKVEKGK